MCHMCTSQCFGGWMAKDLFPTPGIGIYCDKTICSGSYRRATDPWECGLSLMQGPHAHIFEEFSLPSGLPKYLK
jgi:hypothetical protein